MAGWSGEARDAPPNSASSAIAPAAIPAAIRAVMRMLENMAFWRVSYQGQSHSHPSPIMVFIHLGGLHDAISVCDDTGFRRRHGLRGRRAPGQYGQGSG